MKQVKLDDGSCKIMCVLNRDVFMAGGLDEVHGDLEPEVQPSEAEHSGGSSTSAAASSGSGWLAFLSLDYYQSFFDVTTTQVDRRASQPLF